MANLYQMFTILGPLLTAVEAGVNETGRNTCVHKVDTAVEETFKNETNVSSTSLERAIEEGKGNSSCCPVDMD